MRNIATIVLGLAVLALISAGCTPPPTIMANTASTSKAIVHEEVLEKAGLQYYWKRSIPLEPGEVLTNMWCLDENLYFLTSHKNLLAMDAQVGNPKWRVRVTNKHEYIFPPIHVDNVRLPLKVGTIAEIQNPPAPGTLPKWDTVMINSTTRLLVIDRKKGTLIRDFPFAGFSATNRGASDGENYYVGSGSRMYYAVKLLPAANVWWKEIDEEIIKGPMACFSRYRFLGTMDGTFLCGMADDISQRVYRLQLPGPITTAFHVDNRGAFIACGDKNIYGLDSTTGLRLWDPVQFNGIVKDPIQVGSATIFQAVSGEGLIAINLANGSRRWTMRQGRQVLTSMEGALYVLDKDRNLLETNEITGKIGTSLPMSGFDLFPSNLSGQAVFTAIRSGYVFCIRPRTAGRLTVEMLKGK